MDMKSLIKKILKENEDNEWDWVKDTNPIPKSEISNLLSNLTDFGYFVNEHNTDNLVNVIYKLGLDTNTLEKLYSGIYNLAERCNYQGYDDGATSTYDEGHTDGYNHGYEEAENNEHGRAEEEYQRGYTEGYNDGSFDGHKKGYEKGSKDTYDKAFEEGRAYENGLDVEDFERSQSGFDPMEYDEDGDENY